MTVFDATVVKIETDSGFVGYGENTPLGPFYLPAYAEGTRAGVKMLAPSLIGVDATRLNNLNAVMDRTLKGHPYVKSAIDMACWDILGKVSGLPVCELLGGRFNESFKLYRAISQGSPEEMARNVEKYVNEGYRYANLSALRMLLNLKLNRQVHFLPRIFQLKVGGAASDDIERIHAVRAILDAKVRSSPSFCFFSGLDSKSPFCLIVKKTKELKLAGEKDLHMPLLCDANTGQ